MNGVKTKYINDVARGLTQVIMETDNSGVVQAVYNSCPPGRNGRGLISMKRSGANSYYHYDGLGSVRLVTDAPGAVTASYTYDGYGNLIASSGSANNAYGFTGEQQFGEADNLVYLRARYYKPSIGRFMSRDPIGYKGGINLYRYASNNPVNNVDPTGLCGSNLACKITCAVATVTCIGLCNAYTGGLGAWFCRAGCAAAGVVCVAACEHYLPCPPSPPPPTPPSPPGPPCGPVIGGGF